MKCSKALLLSDVSGFINYFSSLAEKAEVDLTVESDWEKMYRVHEDVIICGSKYLDRINEAYHNLIVLILKPEESPFDFIDKGVSRFIYNFKNENEILMAFMLPKGEQLGYDHSKPLEVLNVSSKEDFIYGDYRFLFTKDRYFYKGNEIYLSNGCKAYIADWILNGYKDNSKRTYLYRLRSKFGNKFLSELDRKGNIKG